MLVTKLSCPLLTPLTEKHVNFYIFQTMENVRKHRQIELVHDEKRLLKVSAKPSYKTSKIFNEDLVAAEMYKTAVKLFKPIYCGMAILGMYCFLILSSFFFFFFLLAPCFKDKKITLNNILIGIE